MQQTGTRTFATDLERKRVQAVVETLSGRRQPGSTAAELAHDARNMVTALELYCNLLAEPGVLAAQFLHYASELRLVASACRRLVEKLMLLDGQVSQERGRGGNSLPASAGGGGPLQLTRIPTLPQIAEQRLLERPIDNLFEEMEANRNLLDAMAGLAISLTMRAEGGARPVYLTAEELTRVLVNLVKNAAEAMRKAGRIEITLRERYQAQNAAPKLVLTVEDNGPGIREGLLEQIFEPGFSTHATAPEGEDDGDSRAAHSGLGLSSARSLLEAAGGSIRAENRIEGGARMVIELPVRQR
jgi:signal transduction histidine kinase